MCAVELVLKVVEYDILLRIEAARANKLLLSISAGVSKFDNSFMDHLVSDRK